MAANPAFCDLLGYPRGQPKSIRLSRHYPTATRDELRRMLPTALAGRSIHGRSSLLRTDSSSFRADWTITPLADASGEVRGWLITGRDASEQEQIEALLAERHALIPEIRGMSKLSDMVAGVAHDFSNALTVIQNLTSFALEELTGARDALDVDRIVEQIVEQIVNVLRRALPKRIEIRIDLACGVLVESSESEPGGGTLVIVILPVSGSSSTPRI